MKEIYAEIEIEASAEQIWRQLTDFTNYSHWNPFIRQASGEARVGTNLEIYVKPPGKEGMVFCAKILKAEPNQALHWLEQLTIPHLLDQAHTFTLEPITSGRTRFIQHETVTGWLLPLFGREFEKNAHRGFEAMNQALKVLAEQ